MKQFSKITEVREQRLNWCLQQKSVALVPTMGSIHDGHLSLIERAQKMADKIIVSIFVNPTQFESGSDYKIYPRTIEQDMQRLKRFEPDIVFIPSVDEMYPTGFKLDIEITAPALDNIFCGAYRPGHFVGVTTIISKLFNIVQPNIAVFGKKDYQQLLVIKKLVADLFFPIEIIGVDTIRESGGLALSSRNIHLNKSQRNIANNLYRTLLNISEAIRMGRRNYRKLEADALEYLQKKGFNTEYMSVRNAQDLGEPADSDLIILAAAWLGKTRLIDNIQVRR